MHNVLVNVAAQYQAEKKRADDAERLQAEAQVEVQHLTLDTEANKQRAEKAERLQTESQAKLKQSKDASITNPFALVLIDGDGYIFPEMLLRRGTEGGEAAAHHLRQGLERWIQIDPRFKNTDAIHWRFKVRIYLNLDGLSRKFHNLKIVPDLQTLRQFMTGFTRSQQLFDVIDVGYGKERTDYKIKANFDNDILNNSCKYVILGCAHDNGYIPMLDSYKNNDRVRKRIMILKTEATTQQFKDISLKVFGELELSMLQSSTSLNDPTHSPKSPKLPIALPLKSQPTPPESPRQHPPPVAKSHYYPQPIYINPENQRIDHPIPEPSPEIARAFNQRIKSSARKPCHDFHLTGHCRDQCRFDHTPLSSSDEYLTLARRARNWVCRDEGRCKNAMCYFGHHFPQDVAGRCFRERCSFARFHGRKVDRLTLYKA